MGRLVTVIHPKVMQGHLYNVGFDTVFKEALVCILGFVDLRVYCHSVESVFLTIGGPHLKISICAPQNVKDRVGQVVHPKMEKLKSARP